MEDCDASEWLSRDAGITLSAQTLHQQDGYAMTLLVAHIGGDEEYLEADDSWSRFEQ